jgi:hypothetical protein
MLNPFAPLIAIAKSASCPTRQRYPIKNKPLTILDLPCDASCRETPPDASPGACALPPRQHRAFRPAPGLV